MPSIDRVELTQLRSTGQLEPSPVAKTTTEADGSFQLAAPSVGIYRLKVQAEGQVPAQIHLYPLVADVQLDPVHLVEDVGANVRLLDVDGNPLDGVLVTASRTTRSSRHSPGPTFDLPTQLWHGATEVARTDAEGWVRLHAADGEVVRLQGVAKTSSRVFRDLRATGKPETWTVGQVPTLQLVARDLRGRPMEGVYVYEWDWRVPLGYAWEGTLALGRTNAEGSVHVPFPVERRRLDVVSSEGDWGQLDPSAEDFEPGSIQKVTLQPARRVTGRVLDGRSDRPLPGALVWVSRPSGQSTLADSDGRFEMWVGGERVSLIGAFEAHRPYSAMASLDLDQPMSTTLRPQAVCSAAGIVTDEAGQGIANAELFPFSRFAAQPSSHRAWPWRTDAEGAFHFDRLACEDSHTLRVRAPGFATADHPLPELVSGEPVEGLQFVMDRGRQATGKVVDPQDRPVAGAVVELLPDVRDYVEEQRRRHQKQETTSAADGVFTFNNLAVDRYDITVRASGYPRTTLHGVAVKKDSLRTDLGTISLTAGTTVVGHVVDDLDRPVAGAKVGATANQGRLQLGMIEADGEGRFRLDGLRPGEPVTIRASAKGHVAASLFDVIPGDEGDDPLRIAITRTSTLTGRVVDSDGRPIEGVRLSVAKVLPGGATEGFGVPTDPSGRFEMQDLNADVTELHLVAPDGQTREVPVQMPPPGETADLEIVFETGRALDGIVLAPGGEPLADSRVSVSSPKAAAEVRTDASGRFTFEDLPSGTYSAAVWDEHYGFLSRAGIDLDRETSIELRFPDHLGVSTRVVTTEGAPIFDAEVVFTSATGGGNWRHGRTDRDGRWSTRLPAGQYLVEARKRDFAPATRELRFDVDGQQVEVALSSGTTIRGRVTGLKAEELGRVEVVATGKSATGRQLSRRSGVRDMAGGFELRGFGPGAYTVSASLDNGKRRASTNVEVMADSVIDGVVVAFTEGYDVSGLVLVNREPVSGASVSLQLEGPDGADQWVHTTTQQNGRFLIPDVPAGTYSLMVRDRLWQGFSTRQSVRVDGDVDLTIESTGVDLEGRVLDPNGEPLSGVGVTIGRDAPHPDVRQTVTDSTGSFRFQAIEPGTWTLRVAARKWPFWLQQVEVSDPMSPVEIRLEPTRSLQLKVESAEGRPLGQLVVMQIRGDGIAVPIRASPMGDSQFQLDLPAGRVKLAIAEHIGVASFLDVNVPGDAHHVLPPTGRLRFPPLAKPYLLRVSSRQGDSQPLISSWALDQMLLPPERSFDIVVPEGSWIVQMTDAEGETVEIPVTITAGAEASIELP